MDIVKRLRAWAEIDPSASQDLNESANEIERLREERHGLREVLQFYAEFTKSTSRYRDMVHYLSDGGKLAALALKDGE